MPAFYSDSKSNLDAPQMVSFDLSFISMLIEEIVEDEVSIWTEGSIS